MSSPTFDAERAARANVDPKRPGEPCKAGPGAYEPRVDANRCEGKADCAAVCPYGVFEVGRLGDEAYSQLSFFGRLKSRAHGRRTAFTPHADLCRACGSCVVACPEGAIQLVARRAATGAKT